MSAPPIQQTVLIVDDDAIMRLMTAEALGDAGYRVIEAASAEEGMAVFDRSGADLILLDVILPGMNGFQACAQWRTHPAGANVPIIVMTGLDDRQSIVQAYESGATDFITKPIVWDLLPYRVRYALRANAALQETARSRALLSRSQSLANMGSWEWTCATDRLEWSDEMNRIQGLAPGPQEAQSAALLEQVHPDDREMVEAALALARSHGEAYGIEFRIVRPDGTVRRLVEQTDVERDANDVVSAVRGIRRDITLQTEANERIRTLALFDPLTGLANRSLFRDLLKQWLPHAHKLGKRCAVLVIDLDRFKLINETLGPRVGDEVLKVVSDRLRACLKASGSAMPVDGQAPDERLARLGGDEFTVLLVDVADPHQASLVARRMAEALVAPVLVGEHELTVTASIGISMTPDDGHDMDSLLRNAGTAMHAAKLDVQPRIRFYDEAMGAEIGRKLTVETELRRAIGEGDLRVYYQAKVDLRTMQVVGAEALMRWAHPSGRLVSPAEFIPIAEESGLIVPMTRWLVSEVCCQLGTWGRDGLACVPVSINLDATSLQSDGLIAAVEQALAATGLPPSAIEFEVTESSLMRDLERASRMLQNLRALGIKLSIDDFGTGYSSLTYLKRFPVDVLKIDRSFIQDLTTDASDAALTTAIIAMGRSLKLELVAEGVETWEQAHFLSQRGCHLVQGFLFARPLPSNEFADLLEFGLPGNRAPFDHSI